MRIVQVGTGFLPVTMDGTGATEKIICHLSEALAGLGHDVTVLDSAFPGYELEASRRQYRTIFVQEIPIADANIAAHVARGVTFGVLVRRCLVSLLRHERMDLVCFHNQFSAAAGIRVVKDYGGHSAFFLHNPRWSAVENCKSSWLRALYGQEWYAERVADVVVGLNPAAILNRVEYFGLDSHKAVLSSSGVDDFWFERAEPGPDVRRYLPRADHVIVHVGRFQPYKNQLLLAKALKTLLRDMPEWGATFVGPVDDSQYAARVSDTLREEIDAGRVVFAGPIHSRRMLRDLLSLSSCFVFPSLWEGSPLALLEAMAVGLPVVASSIPGIREILSNGVGVCVSPSSEVELRSAVAELMQSPERRRRLGEKARERAGAYRWERVAETLIRGVELRLSSHSTDH